MKTANYTNGPIGEVKIIPDFLPSPNKFAFKKASKKGDLSLNKAAIDFLKQQTIKHSATKYQSMGRTLVGARRMQHNTAA